MKNLTQATYDRIRLRAERGLPQTQLDIGDLLEAYEGALMHLDKALAHGHTWQGEDEAAEFVYTDLGDPRVSL